MPITKTRQRLIEVARELFAKNGLEATTMNDIAKASGRGRRTLYTYFRHKEEIYYAVIEEELALLSEKMEGVTKMHAEPQRFNSDKLREPALETTISAAFKA